MRYDYRLADGRLHQAESGAGNVVIYSDPTPEERTEILSTLPVEAHTLHSMLDPEEISRGEFEPGCNVMIWKRSGPEASDHTFPVTSVGLILQDDRLTIIERERYHLPYDREHSAPNNLRELLLRGMQESVEEFMQRLRFIKQTSKEVQSRLTKTLDNRELLRMFDLSESLAYAVDAIDANAYVMQRLLSAAKSLGFSEKEIDLLDEIAIDNAQLSRQGHIYITVFAGLMDARFSIVNNNMNVLLKNLTIVNVIFLPLNVIAGIGGMSEFTMALSHYRIPWQVGYLGFTLALVLVAVLIAMGLRYWIAHMIEREINSATRHSFSLPQSSGNPTGRSSRYP